MPLNRKERRDLARKIARDNRRARRPRHDSKSERRAEAEAAQKKLFEGDAQKNAFLGTEYLGPSRPRTDLHQEPPPC